MGFARSATYTPGGTGTITVTVTNTNGVSDALDPVHAPIAAAPRGRCPCGSGRRYKRCCGAPGRPPRAVAR
jgi:hypothetical protein